MDEKAPGCAAPPVSVEMGWDEGGIPEEIRHYRSFVSGDQDGCRLRVRYFRRESDGAVVGRIWFGPESRGPPGYAHGGSIAAVLDEAMGIMSIVSGNPVLTVKLETRFLRRIPLGTDAFLEAKIVEVSDGKVVAFGSIMDREGGASYAESTGYYRIISR